MHNAWIFPPNFFIEYFSLQTSAKIIHGQSAISLKKRTIKSYGSAASWQGTGVGVLCLTAIATCKQ